MSESTSNPPKLTLQRLSTVFAKLMSAPGKSDSGGKSDTPGQPEVADDTEAIAQASPAEAALTPQAILEAMLFVGNEQGEPLTAAALAKPIRDVEPDEIPELVEELNQTYRQTGTAYEIVAEAGGYRMQVAPRWERLKQRFHGQVREAKLTPAALEVLAVVAYRQPISGEQVNQLRGTRCHAILASLVRRQLLQVERDSEKSAVTRYTTTSRFNQLFNVASPADLPRTDEHEDAA